MFFAFFRFKYFFYYIYIHYNISLIKIKSYNAGFSDSTIIYLGTGTTFDLKKYSYYANLTQDNFIIEPVNISVDYVSPAAKPAYAAEVTTHVWGNSGIVKSYNQSTGTLSAYVYCGAYSSRAGDPQYGTTTTGRIKAYLIPPKQ